MKKYKAYISQGGGCDYTIACGETVIHLTSTNWSDAFQELYQRIKEEYSHDERRLDKVELYEIEHEQSIDIKQIYRSIGQANEQMQLQLIEEHEKKEYERLKSKFEKQ